MNFLSKLIEKGQSLLGIEHVPTAEQAVIADRFDHAYYEDMLAGAPSLNKLIDGLGKEHDYVAPFIEDVFQAAYKADPQVREVQDMKPSHLPNRTMLQELQESQQFQSMRATTRGDEYGATMAVLAMEPAIVEVQTHMKEARKKAKEAQEAAEQAQQAQQQLQMMMQQQQQQQGPEPDPTGEPGGPGQGNAGQGLQQAIDQAAQAQSAAQAAQALAQSASEQAAANARQQLKDAAQKAADELDKEGELMRAFGVDDGELSRMDFETRRELAQKLRNNRLAQFSKLLGQFKAVQQSESRRRVQNVATEVVGVKLGNDLQRMIPAEMLNLATPELEDDFWMRWADHAILEFDMAGKEKMGQGPVICVVDESGSMGATDVAGGTREAWSKALALALCDQARQRGRDFHYIGFSSQRQVWTCSFPGGKTRIEDVITMTEHFYGGGTHYEAPLRQALALIEENYDSKGNKKPDIVFMTDDEYGTMNETFMAEWNRVKDKTDVRCFGVAIGCGYSGTLKQVSDNVRSIQELTQSDPRVMADLFRTI